MTAFVVAPSYFGDRRFCRPLTKFLNETLLQSTANGVLAAIVLSSLLAIAILE